MATPAPAGEAAATRDQRASFALWFVDRLEICPVGFVTPGDLWVDHMTWAARTAGARPMDRDQLRAALAAMVNEWEVCREGYRGLKLKPGGPTLRVVS